MKSKSLLLRQRTLHGFHNSCRPSRYSLTVNLPESLSRPIIPCFETKGAGVCEFEGRLLNILVTPSRNHLMGFVEGKPPPFFCQERNQAFRRYLAWVFLTWINQSSFGKALTKLRMCWRNAVGLLLQILSSNSNNNRNNNTTPTPTTTPTTPTTPTGEIRWFSSETTIPINDQLRQNNGNYILDY